MSSYFTIEEASFDDWKRVVDLCTETDRWSFTYDDFHVWKKAFGEDKSRFLAAKASDGDVLGFVCMAKFDPNITTIGMHYVQPKYRGQGIGTQLFDKIMQDSKAQGRNICLNGISYMSEKYADRKGLNNYADWILSILNINGGADTSKIAHLAGNSKVVNISDVDVAKIAAYDQSVAANIDRSKLVEAWLNHPAAWSKVALDGNGSVVGYGAARMVTLDRLLFGPLYANDKATAAALIKAILDHDTSLPTRRIQFFSPSTNDDLFDVLELLSGGNCDDGGYFVSQFTGQLLTIDTKNVYAVSDHALGFI
uniref:N-acetyltransferase domain-containing protein n=1 Tax=Plectus sambesii TaxID=2011161 RepID=A0A914VWV7_9BILA